MTPVDFRIPSGADLPARVLSADRSGDDVRLVIEVDPDAWQTIDLVMLFHLRWNVRDPGEVSGERPVQLGLRLDDALVAESAAVELPAGLAGLPADHPLRSTQSWYATEVTEAVDLPPGFTGSGELRQGFTTRWAVERDAT